MSEVRFNEKYQEAKEQLHEKLGKACAADPSIGAVMLVAVKAHREGPAWQPKVLVSQLLLSICTEWQTLAGRLPALKIAGRANPFTKPSLQEVCDKLGEAEVCPATRNNVFHLKHFLKACTSLKKRMIAFHKMLSRSKVLSKFRQTKCPGMPGSLPWMGTNAMFRALYKSL